MPCSTRNVLMPLPLGADGSVTAHTDTQCVLEVAPSTNALPPPVTIQAIASSAEIAVFGGSADVEKTALGVVLYRNNSDAVQTGLKLTLPAFPGVQ